MRIRGKKTAEKKGLPLNHDDGGGGGSRKALESERQWQIHYACFFGKPPLLPPSSSRGLRPIARKKWSGVWLSSSSSLLSLQLMRHSHGVALVISLQGTVYEEHHISKLHFSWPQVSCSEQCPGRASRVIFASYRDCSGQVQKFAMRFLTSSDSEEFVNCLKESLNSIVNIGLNCKFGSESSRQVKRKRSNGVCNGNAQKSSNENLVWNFEPPEQPQLICEDMQNTCFEEPLFAHVSEAKDAPLPSSFSAPTSDSCTRTEQEMQEIPPGFYLKSQVEGCKSGSSFHEMLSMLERFINELGGDLAL